MVCCALWIGFDILCGVGLAAGGFAITGAVYLLHLEKFRPIVQMEIGHKDAALDLPNYTAWQSPGGPNKVCIPNESAKNKIAEQLGWQQVK